MLSSGAEPPTATEKGVSAAVSWRVERGCRQREATSGAAPLSPSYGVVSSTTARWLDASDGAARIGTEAASDTTVRTGDFYTAKQLPDATAQLGQSGCGAARHRQ
jgi:hypothetical protein